MIPNERINATTPSAYRVAIMHGDKIVRSWDHLYKRHGDATKRRDMLNAALGDSSDHYQLLYAKGWFKVYD